MLYERWSMHAVSGETNTALHEELDGLFRKQYETATKSLRNTAQQLTSSQQLIQVITVGFVLPPCLPRNDTVEDRPYAANENVLGLWCGILEFNLSLDTV